MRFWDTSALVSLLVQDEPATLPRQWLTEDHELVVWTMTKVEVCSALGRLVREGSLTAPAAKDIETVADEMLERAHVITEVPRIKEGACRLLRIHALRAGDALQLGAALAWSNGSPKDLTLHTFDRRLGLAAEREGFRVVGI